MEDGSGKRKILHLLHLRPVGWERESKPAGRAPIFCELSRHGDPLSCLVAAAPTPTTCKEKLGDRPPVLAMTSRLSKENSVTDASSLVDISFFDQGMVMTFSNYCTILYSNKISSRGLLTMCR